jgi:hypothetical protein
VYHPVPVFFFFLLLLFPLPGADVPALLHRGLLFAGHFSVTDFCSQYYYFALFVDVVYRPLPAVFVFFPVPVLLFPFTFVVFVAAVYILCTSLFLLLFEPMFDPFDAWAADREGHHS